MSILIQSHKNIWAITLVCLFYPLALNAACTTIPTIIPGTGYTISAPGCYELAGETSFTGATPCTFAITVNADDVTIDLKGFTLSVDPLSGGISASGVTNFVLKNGSIVSTANTNSCNLAVQLTNVDNFTFDRIRTSATFQGITLTGCSNGKFTKCVQENHNTGFASNGTSSAALFVTGCINVSFDECQYQNNIYADSANTFAVTVAIHISGPNQRDTRFSKCLFYNSGVGIEGPDFPATEGGNSGALIEESIFIIENPNYSNQFLYMIGRPHGVTIRGCSFTNLNAHKDFDGILIYDGSNILIEDCIIESNANGFGTTPVTIPPFPSYGASIIHVGYTLSFGDPVHTPLVADNVTIRNCTISGGSNDPSSQRAFHAIYVELPANGIVIENVNISHINSGTQPSVAPGGPGSSVYDPVLGGAIRVDGANGVVIKNVKLNDVASGPEAGAGPGDGIVLGGAYTFNIYYNGQLSETFDVPASINCTVQDCNVTGCSGVGIRNDSPKCNNLVVNNLSFNNGCNYKGVPQKSIVNQGDKAVAGENLRPSKKSHKGK